MPTVVLPTAWWFAFRRDELVLLDGEPWEIPHAGALADVAPVRVQSIGTLGGVPAYAAELSPDAVIPTGYRTAGLRALAGRLDTAALAAAAYGFQIQYWDRTHQFCGACGAATAMRPDERARACPRCSHVYFPRIAPCTITLVHDGPRVLLARQASWPPGRYGLVAGYVEPNESLESCAVREILEETSVEVTDVTYAGSQPWPFPHQIMVGFTARYVRGTVVPRAGEIEDARWFTVDTLPLLPPGYSIARVLIDRWVAGQQGTPPT